MPSWQSSLGILDLFCLNGAFLLLPSILSLLVVMTVFFGSFHFFFFFCELEGFLKFRLVFTWSLKYCKEGITAMKISSRFYYRLEKNPSTLSILTVCFVPFFLMLWLVNLFLIGLCLLFIWHLCICSWYPEFLKQKNPESEGFHTFKKPNRFKSNCIISQQFHALGDFACLVSFQKSA